MLPRAVQRELIDQYFDIEFALLVETFPGQPNQECFAQKSAAVLEAGFIAFRENIHSIAESESRVPGREFR
jgi:hypothetical protein